MPEITLTHVPWAPGTPVGAYPRHSEQMLPNQPPTGVPVVDTQAVAGDASLTYPDLSVGDYWAAADLGGLWRYVAFTAAEPAVLPPYVTQADYAQGQSADDARLDALEAVGADPRLDALEATDAATDTRLDAAESAIVAVNAATAIIETRSPALALMDEVTSARATRIGSLSTAFEIKLLVAAQLSKLMTGRFVCEAAVTPSVTNFWTIALAKYAPPSSGAIIDSFDTLAAAQLLPGVYTEAINSTANRLYGSTEGGSLMPATANGLDRFYWRNDFLTADASAAVEVFGIKPDTGSATTDLRFKIIDKDNYISCRLTLGHATTPIMRIHSVNAGVFTQLASVNLTSVPADGPVHGWMRAQIAGNVVTVERWADNPKLGGTAMQSLSFTLTGADITKYGTGVQGRVGFSVLSTQPTYMRLDNFSVEGVVLNPTSSPIVSKTTKPFAAGTNGQKGEGITPNQAWKLDGYPIASDLRILKDGAVVVATFTPTGVPDPIVNPTAQMEWMPL